MARYNKNYGGAVKAARLDDLPDFITPIEAGQVLRVNSNTVGCWIRAGRLPAVKTGSRIYRIRKTDFIDFINSSETHLQGGR